MGACMISQNGKPCYGVVEMIVDTESDIAKLPTHYGEGSSAVVLDTGAVYFFMGGEWKALKNSGGE